MIQPISWQKNKLLILDQTKLPFAEKYITVDNIDTLVKAIRHLAIRGAPLLGIAAAYGLYLGASHYSGDDYQGFVQKCEVIKQEIGASRPTAVNLFRMLDRQMALVKGMHGKPVEAIKEALLTEARAIHAEDRALCQRIGEYGNNIIPESASILTHCNTGALATGGIGTALGVIITAHESGKKVHVYVDETRPLLQGARLTTWELQQNRIPATLITDSMAGFLFKQGKLDVAIVGADRIAANGDVANKIGTYSLAVLSNYHKVPFYIAAPGTTIDFKLENGDKIPIEIRESAEIVSIEGTHIAPENIATYSPAFDVTPHKLITGIITEKGIIRKPFTGNLSRYFG